MPDTAQSSEDHNSVADQHRSQPNHNGMDAAVELARVVTRLDSIHDDVRELVREVGEQNIRIGKLETERALVQLRNVEAARAEISLEGKLEEVLKRCECRMGDMGERVRGLETSRDELTGMQLGTKIDTMDKRIGTVEGLVSQTKGGLATAAAALQTVLAIAALMVSIYAVSRSIPSTQQHEPAAQHQAVK